MITTPTIGRKVWFWPNGTYLGLPAMAQPQCQDPKQAMDATIVLVHSDRMVNLLVIDHAGLTWPVPSVTLLQEGDDILAGSMYAQWMPYQAAQAKKEAVEKSQQAAIEEAIGMVPSSGKCSSPNLECGQTNAVGSSTATGHRLRDDLIRSLVGAAGPVLVVSPFRATEIGKGIVDLVEAVLNPAPEVAPVSSSQAKIAAAALAMVQHLKEVGAHDYLLLAEYGGVQYTVSVQPAI